MFTGLFLDSFTITPYLEQSKSEVVWSIPAGPSSFYSPNILSELTYKDVKARGLGLNLAYLNKVSDHWALYLEGDYSDTSIKSGSSQDSDYLGDNRTEEFSRSYADVDDDSSVRTSFTIGMKTRWFDSKGHYFTFLFGHQKHQLNMTTSNGVQYIPEESRGSPMTGLNSTFNSEFSSWYSGVATEHVFKWGTIGIRYERHDVEYDSEADWNLREDLAHPTSFIQSGEGKGTLLTLGYSYQVNLNWDLFFNYTRRDYDIKEGYDQTFASDGSSYVTTLNGLQYDSEQYQIGFRYIMY
ncbi:MAG: hypothetical protein N0E56_15730 [Candidatus Thiodiazotropha endolucinida]|nr:hypothetical protein [Candidatus Thiodiazotropha taylori]MCW4268073.1 hypothetical protein [Candidatus Thiodiazotropha endolucinida]